MQTNTSKEDFQQFLKNSDNRLTKKLNTTLQKINDEEEIESQFTNDDILIFDQRREKRISGESKTYNWEQAKSIVVPKENRL